MIIKKILVIKFGGKLGDTIIGINQILLKDDPKKFLFCFQNKPLLYRLNSNFNTENIEMPEVKYSFKNIIKFVIFFTKLFFKRNKIKEIYILEWNTSIYYKIIRILFFNKKVHFIESNNKNEYQRINNLFKEKSNNKFLSLSITDNSYISFVKGKKYIVIGLGSETWKWRSPNAAYRTDILSEIEKSMKQLDYIILIGKGTNDASLSNEIMKKTQNKKIINLVDKTNIEELGELLSNAKINIMVDSGLAHLAHLFAPAEIMLFGPDSPERWFPEGYKNRYKIYNKQQCSPCKQNWKNKNDECIMGTGICLNSIIVIKEIQNIVNKLIS